MATILIVEDNAALGRLYGRGFAERGHTVLNATTTVQAAQLLHEHTPEVVILDLMLPDGSGADLLKRIRTDERFNDTEFVVVSGKVECFERCKALGVRHFLEKPATVVAIWEVVSRILSDKGHQAVMRRSTQEMNKPVS